MTEIRVKDLGGAAIKCVDVDGYTLPYFMRPEAVIRPVAEIKNIFDNVPNLPLRDDDIMLCSFPKTGTNWLFEILKMILNKSAKRIEGRKVVTMIEALTEEEMDKQPSPRVMNTHLDYRFLPKDMRTRNTKTILVLRNPKDAAVSYFNHMKGVKLYEYDGQWKDWLPLWMEGKLEYAQYSNYLKDWERAISEGVGFPLHVLYYEDLKLGGKHEIRRLAEFLGIELDEQTSSDIVDMCGFDKMATEKKMPEELEKKFLNTSFKFYRKGQIGDWKNWFTVAEDEKFNQYWDEEMKGTTFAFKYNGQASI